MQNAKEYWQVKDDDSIMNKSSNAAQFFGNPVNEAC